MNKETKIILIIFLVILSLYVYQKNTNMFSISSVSQNNQQQDINIQQGIFLKEYCIKNGGIFELNNNICYIQNMECNLDMFIFHKCPNQS